MRYWRRIGQIAAVLKNLRDIPHLFDSNGHTRLHAAIAAGIDDVPVVLRAFWDEDTAVEYAIHCQRDRRNLSGADILRWIAEVDKRKTAQERAAMAGRPKAGENLTSREVKLSPHHARSSAQQTADIVGTSRAKVEKARTVLDKATDEVKEAVEKGEMSINQAYNETVQRSKPLKIGPPSNGLTFCGFAISQMERIQENDTERSAAWDKMRNWLDKNE